MLASHLNHIHSILTTDQKVLGLVSLNVLLEAIYRWSIHMETFLRVLVPLGQFAVAVATVWFIVKKGNRLDLKKPDDDKEP